MSSTRKKLLRVAVVAAALSSAALVACGGGSSDSSTSSEPSAAADAAAATTPIAEPSFDPTNFGETATGANPYLPISPGTQWTRDGTTIVGGRVVPHQVTTTITDVVREINGVPTVAMLDVSLDSGQISQISLDYVAEDKDGNVWVAGGYTEEYEGGRFVSSVDPWIDGINGAKAGILVQGDPKAGTPPYDVALVEPGNPDVAEVFEVGTQRCVPFNCFDDVLIVREGMADARDNEFKYYARDVGQIENEPRGDSVHEDVEALINLTDLSPRALTEASDEALRLDTDAPKQSPKVFGDFPVGQRA